MKRNAFGKERIKNGRCREDTDETCPQKSSRGAPLSLESRSHLWLGLRSDAGRGGGRAACVLVSTPLLRQGDRGSLLSPQPFLQARRFHGMLAMLQERWTHS